ncbi:MAG TPA: hypothetical protein VFS40_09540, partial [Gemmatimonadales bacterium]|nr:hypothetical protein [Gemmatimonadales bacterium]
MSFRSTRWRRRLPSALRTAALVVAGSGALGACALPGAAPGPVPLQRAWPVAQAPIYREWWARTEACSGHRGNLDEVRFYAVDDVDGQIYLGNQRALAWWVRDGNRIYLPQGALLDEMLVRHEMLHALTQAAHHPTESFVRRCHVASARTWQDST